ncbi:kinesin-related protein 4 isoform X2 [Cephus cinctus]|uniref:Kinesin-related protein 4 isoform X2 n=1 Tax=Cephus cinctus TaxID=211228 RepID=A0AAJ7FSM6_CEPCN|nr:kinesin-related protein 4 isoform X2 [Cephus cinctus]
MSDNIKVAIRVRPLIKREKDDGLPVQWQVQGNSIIRGEGRFSFDHIFDMKNTNEDIFQAVVKPIVDAAINGFNGTVFAYGQTSSGKTYTMMGIKEEPGVIPLAVNYIFDAIANTVGREFLLRVSYLEIYNEKVNDLIDKNGIDLKVHEDNQGQIIVKCKEEVAISPDKILTIMKKGEKNRRIGETNMNDRSSRSHTIFRITIESRELEAASDGAVNVSQLNLVDLAGSERARQTGATGERFNEGRHINLSLSSLGLVIMQLSDSQDREKFVNFRDSKLTRILQASLGGNAMTAMICAVTPAAIDETQCTLAFASRAKSVKNKPQLNEVLSDSAMLKRYAIQLNKLHAELEKVRQGNRCAEVEEMESKLQEKERRNQLLEERIELLQTRIMSGCSTNSANQKFKSEAQRRRTWGGCGTLQPATTTFQSAVTLPTIKETGESPEKVRRDKIKKRQSIIQSSDIEKEDFQTEFTDFELDLIESERRYEAGRLSVESLDCEDEPYVTKRRPENRVKFLDDVTIRRISCGDNADVPINKTVMLSPPKSNLLEDCPETPKEVLRYRIHHLSCEMKSLREYANSEKQRFQEEATEPKSVENSDDLNYLKKSLADSEALYLDTIKKYSELQSDHEDLLLTYETGRKECEELKEQVESLQSMQKQFGDMETEQKRLKAEVKKVQKECQDLQNKHTDTLWEMELLVKKHKTREEELENSLQVAWEQLKTKSSTTVTEDNSLTIENHGMKSKVEEFNTLMKTVEEEKRSLAKEVARLSQRPTHDEVTLLQQKIDNLTVQKIELEGTNEVLNDKLSVAVDCTQYLSEKYAECLSMIPNDESSPAKAKVIESKVQELTKLLKNTSNKSINLLGKLERLKEYVNECMTYHKTSILMKTEDELSTKVEEVKNFTDSHVQKSRDSVCTENIRHFIVKTEHNAQDVIDHMKEHVPEVSDFCSSVQEENQHNDKLHVLERLQVLNEHLSKENLEIKSKYTETIDKLTNYEHVIELLKNDIDKLTLKLKEKDTEWSLMKSKVEELQNLTTQLELSPEKDKIDRDTNRLLELQTQLTTLKNDLITAVAEVKQKELEIGRLNEAMAMKANEVIDNLKTIDRMHQENQDLQTHLKNVIESSTLQTASVQETINSLGKFEESQPEISFEQLYSQSFSSEKEAQESSDNFDEEHKASELRKTSMDTQSVTKKKVFHQTSELKPQFLERISYSNESNVKINSSLSDTGVETACNTSNIPCEENSELEEKLKLDQVLAENSELKNKIELFIQEVTLHTAAIADFESFKTQVEIDLSERDKRISKIQADNDKLREQVIIMQSDRTKLEGDKCAMEKLIKEKNEQLQKLSNLESQLSDIVNEKMEFERISIELRKELTKKSQDLESNDIHKYESEIQNLQSYVTNLQSFVKNVQNENDELKKQLQELQESAEKTIDLKQRTEELTTAECTRTEAKQQLESELHQQNETKLKNSLLTRDTETSTVASPHKPILDKTVKTEKSPENEKESSSIFANASYFENMDTSYGQNESDLENLPVDVADLSVNEDITKLNDIPTLKKRIEDLEDLNKRLETENKIFFHKVSDDDSYALADKKIEESDEIRNDIQSLKCDIGKFTTTIQQLTTENMELSNKLNEETKHAGIRESNLQKTIDELYLRISNVEEEKTKLQNDLEICYEQIGMLRARTPVATEETVKAKFVEYQRQIDELTIENNELSSDVMETLQELEEIKGSKVLLFDHDCLYKQDAEKYTKLRTEHDQLLENIMKKGEEHEALVEKCRVLESKLELSLENQTSGIAESSESNLEMLITENNKLKGDIIELNSKMTILTDENMKYSENLFETMEKLDDTRRASCFNEEMYHSLVMHDDDARDTSIKLTTDESVQTLTNNYNDLLKQFDYVKRLNKKLSDLKFSSCSHCEQRQSLNENRTALKLEVKSLSYKLENMQKKFDQKCADIEVLKNKTNEDLNLTIMGDMTLSESLLESTNVSFAEEKVQALNSDLERLKDAHDKLSEMYKNKCDELDNLQDTSHCESSSTHSNSNSSYGSKKDARIEKMETEIFKLQEDLHKFKKAIARVSSVLPKINNEKANLERELEALESIRKELDEKVTSSEILAQEAIEKNVVLQGELVDSRKEVDQLNQRVKAMQSEKLNLEVKVDTLTAEKETSEKVIEELKVSVFKFTEKCIDLVEELEAIKQEREALIKDQGHRDNKHKEILDAALKDCKEHTMKEAEKQLKELQATLNKNIKDNEELEKQLTALQLATSKDTDSAKKIQDNTSKFLAGPDSRNYTELSTAYKKLVEECNASRINIIKEIKALNPKFDSSEYQDATVADLLRILLQTFLTKEKEIIQALQDNFEEEKKKLTDEKNQSENAEERTKKWAKELEFDNDKLLRDLSEEENNNKKLNEEIDKLKNLLIETNYEKDLLKLKVESLMTDLSALQADFETKSKTDLKQGEIINATQERERQALEQIKSREAELQCRLKFEKETYNQRIEELICSLESYKTKNMDLRSNVEGLEANEKQLKNIIDMKSNELSKHCQTIEKLNNEITILTENCAQLNEDNAQKAQRIEEITAIVKKKCDMASEFKTKLETIAPEYELLKEQIKEKKLIVEKCRKDMDILQVESKKQVDAIQDSCNNISIECEGLKKQLAELNNKNTSLVCQLQAAEEKCEELQESNNKLTQKMRNSTSKIQVEARIEELQDQIGTLKNNLEGASNRITELQESKNHVMRELVELRGKYDILRQEKIDLQNSMASYKSKLGAADLIELRSKYETLLQEKSKLALEVEGNKLLIMKKDKELIQHKNEISQLKIKNQELDDEIENQVLVINDQNKHINELTEKLFDNKECIHSNCALNTNISHEEQTKRIESLTRMTDILRKENAELHTKILELENKTDTISCNSSRSDSPLFENSRRKQRRSDLFNHNRQLEPLIDQDTDPIQNPNCMCSTLRKQIHELELQLVSKNGKIATLEIQIQSENFPYQKKCKDLEENLLIFKNKNAELKMEIKRLNRSLLNTSVKDCDVCRRRHINKRDRSTQCTSLPAKTYFSSTSSGIIDEHVKIEKLEKEKNLMKDLCRSRSRQINELQQRIEELESNNVNTISNTKLLSTQDKSQTTEQSSRCIRRQLLSTQDKSQTIGQSSRRPMKENIPANVLDVISSTSLQRSRNMWSNYQ